MNNPTQFINDLKQWNITLSERQIKQFMDYYELLVEWNSFMNLTAITEFEDVCKKHFLDSLSVIHAIPYEELLSMNLSLIDIGTGAGFPGIPIAIVFPNIKVTLLDSLNKRINFLNTVIEKLSLDNCITIHGRAEDFAKPSKLREQYDLCVSRAVANLTTLSEYCLPYIKLGGYFISYKSEKIAEEAIHAEHAISVLGGKVKKQVDLTLPQTDIYRNMFMIEKIHTTPKKYPRKAGTPSKEPLH